MSRSENFKTRITELDEFLRWAKVAKYGDFCVYHEGHLSADRTENPVLNSIAETVLLLQDTGWVYASQNRMFTDIGNAYFATRSGKGFAPRSVMSRDITAAEYRTLYAINSKQSGVSIVRVIRDSLSTSSDARAERVLRQLRSDGWVEPVDTGKGWKITDVGRKLLV